MENVEGTNQKMIELLRDLPIGTPLELRYRQPYSEGVPSILAYFASLCNLERESIRVDNLSYLHTLIFISPGYLESLRVSDSSWSKNKDVALQQVKERYLLALKNDLIEDMIDTLTVYDSVNDYGCKSLGHNGAHKHVSLATLEEIVILMKKG